MSTALEFATDPITAAGFAQAVHALAAAQPSLKPWLLIDAALLDPSRLASALRRNGWHGVNALATSPLAAYGPRGPQLVEIPQDSDAADEGFRRISAGASNAPAFSWLASSQPVEQLQACCGYLAQTLHDGLRLHCRMSDTRVLPVLLAALSAPQARRVAQTIAQWQWFGREGEVTGWHAPALQGDAIDTQNHLELDASQFASLLDAAEADSIFAQLVETVPQLVPPTGRASFHQRLQRGLAMATSLHVAGNPDRRQFIVLSLTCGDGFYKHPDLSDTWRAVAQGASLSVLMKDWSDDLWNALERAS